jgi:hypothetical protein
MPMPLTIGTSRALLSSGATLPPGLAAAWTLDDTSGGYVDFVGGRTLTQVGTGVTTAEGIIGDAARVPSSGNLSTPNHATFASATGMALEQWAWFATTIFAGEVVCRGVSFADTEYDIVHLGSAGGDAWLFRVNNGLDASWVSPRLASTWYHVVGVLDVGNVQRLYVDGVLRASSAPRTLRSSTFPLEYGARNSGTRMDGRIDEPRIWQFGAKGDPGAAFWLDRYNAGAGRRP